MATQLFYLKSGGVVLLSVLLAMAPVGVRIQAPDGIRMLSSEARAEGNKENGGGQGGGRDGGGGRAQKNGGHEGVGGNRRTGGGGEGGGGNRRTGGGGEGGGSLRTGGGAEGGGGGQTRADRDTRTAGGATKTGADGGRGQKRAEGAVTGSGIGWSPGIPATSLTRITARVPRDSRVETVVILGDDIEVSYSTGWREVITQGLYGMTDASGGKVVERAAAPADRDRLRALAGG